MPQFSATAGQQIKNKQTGEIITAKGVQEIGAGKSGQFFSGEQYEPYITRDASKDLVGGSSNVSGQVTDLTNAYKTVTAGSAATATPVTPIPQTDMEKAKAASEAAAANVNTTTTDDEQKIKDAGTEAGSKYQYLLDQAQKEKAKGLGSSEISAGQAGGFMSTQFVGAAAEAGLSPEQGRLMERYGVGGELTRIKSEYDANINNLESQKQSAITAAENSMRTFIQTGKQSAFDNASKLFEQAQAMNKAKIDETNAMADQMQKQANYVLELQKFEYQQYSDTVKNNLDSKKMDIDIAGLTGKWNGQMTLDVKKQMIDEQYKKMGLELDAKKFDWTMSSDQLKQDLEQKKYDLEKSKSDAQQNGVNINQSVQDAINGVGGIEKGQPGYQAFKAALASEKTVYKEEAKNTGNAYYDLKASVGNSGGLSDTQQTNLGKAFTVADQLDDLQSVFDSMKKAGKTGAIIGKMKKMDFTDPDVVAFKAQLAGIIPNVARGIFGEVGVLTDNDMANYSKAIANIDNPDAAFQVVFNNLLKNLKNKATNDLTMAANNQKNVSGFANDYQNFVNKINSKLGVPPLKQSTNPLVYDGVTSYRSGVGEEQFSKWAQQAAVDMQAAGITDIEDYFDGLKEAARSKDILKNVPTDTGGSGGTIKPTFKNVGADTNKGVGSLSQKYESGGDPAAIGYDTTGGYSYGKYQMAHNTANNFITQSKYAKDFKGLTFNSPQWQTKWKEIAKKDPNGFSGAQESYITQQYLVPQLNKVVNAGIDISKFSPVLQDVVFSTAVQHGANTDIITKAYNDAKKTLGRAPDDNEFITQIYNERWSNGERFKSSTPEVQASVKKRLISERNDALKLI